MKILIDGKLLDYSQHDYCHFSYETEYMIISELQQRMHRMLKELSARDN